MTDSVDRYYDDPPTEPTLVQTTARTTGTALHVVSRSMLGCAVSAAFLIVLGVGLFIGQGRASGGGRIALSLGCGITLPVAVFFFILQGVTCTDRRWRDVHSLNGDV